MRAAALRRHARSARSKVPLRPDNQPTSGRRWRSARSERLVSAARSAAESGVCKERAHGNGDVADPYDLSGRGETSRYRAIVR